MPPESRRPSSVATSAAATPAPEGSTGPDLALEWEIFWTTHWKKGVITIVLALVGIVAFSAWQYLQHSALTAANAALSAAKSIDELKKVIADFPSSPVAADAGLLLARKQAEAKDFEGAAKSAQTVADQFPNHPMRGLALLAAAANLDAAGKADAADAAYKAVVEKVPNDFTAPLAQLGRANLAKLRGKPDDARKIFSEISAKYPGTPPAIQAAQELRYLRGGSGASDIFKVPAPTPAPSPAPAAAATPAPAAAPEASPQAGPSPAAEIKAPAPAAAAPAATPAAEAPKAAAGPTPKKK